MDIKKLRDARAAHEVAKRTEILNDSGGSYDPPSFMSILGADSSAVRDGANRSAARMLAAKAEDDDQSEEAFVEEVLARLDGRVERAAVAVTAWEEFNDDGVELECTTENVEAVLSYGSILSQVEKAARSHSSGFSTASSGG